MKFNIKHALRVTAVAGAACLGLAAYPQFAEGADHTDGGAVTADPLTDINDIYSWMSPDAANLNLAMSVGGLSTITFDDSVVYDFTITRGAAPGDASVGTENHFRCSFDAAGENFECWLLGDAGAIKSYAAGAVDANVAPTAEGMQVFIGPRNDAFVFDLGRFLDTTDFIAENLQALIDSGTSFDDNGCLTNEGASMGIRDLLLPPTPADAVDTFAGVNAQHIIVTFPKALLDGEGDTLSVWASTHTR
ncbi:MAG: DUF4331 family protein [Myxococcota bacterium]